MKKMVTIKTKDATYKTLFNYEKNIFEDFLNYDVFKYRIINPDDIISIEIEKAPDLNLTY